MNDIKGFSVRNCQFMIQFYKEYNQELTFTKPSVSQNTDYQIAKRPVSQMTNKYKLPIGISEYELGQSLTTNLHSTLPSIEDIENQLNK